MQSAPPRHVLLVGTTAAVLERVGPPLTRAGADVHSVRPSDIVLDLLMGTPFELLLVGYPLPEIDIHQLLRVVRLPGSASQTAGVLLLARPGFFEAARALLPAGANRAADLSWADGKLWQTIDDLLHVAPRARLKSMLFADVSDNGACGRYLYRTVNISRSGVLIQGDQMFAPGTPFEFAFRLPTEPRPVEGQAQVVRRVDSVREGMVGLGARFLRLTDDGPFRISQYVKYFNADDGARAGSHPVIRA